jgi:predicted phage terminase large subunit-like protein
VLPSKSEIAAERTRRSLLRFVIEAWPVVCPGSVFVPGLHVTAICRSLEAVASGVIRRLLVNVPPRHGKSTIASIAFVAWLWATRPELRFLCASYGQELAVRDSVQTRRLIESEFYRSRYGSAFALTGDQNQKSRFENDRGGVRLATSVGGFATGEGGDIIVVDDPLKIEDAGSVVRRQGAIDWFDYVLSTRLNDPRTGAVVVIGQRLHERDAFGHLLEQGGWEHLCLAAEYDPAHPFLWRDDPRSEPGQLLWPERFGPAEVAELKRQLGSYGAAGQLQQLPAPAGGGIFQRSWWCFYDPDGPLPRFDELLQSWDLAFSGGPGADYVVGQLWGITGANRYLLHQLRGQLDFPQTIAAIRQLTTWAHGRFPGRAGHAIVIEKAANAAAAVSLLSREIPGIIPFRPEGDKLVRAHAVSPQVEAGNVYLPGARAADGVGYDRVRTPEWVQGLVEEAAAFPGSAYDDQVDALTQALIRASRPGPRIRVL